MTKVKHNKSAFSIAEMAVVLVVVGILASMVVIASGFVQNGKIQGLIYEFSAHREAIKKFFDTYRALPGDFDRASIAIHPSLSNGNGNQRYEVSTSGLNETFMAWSHMKYANLISGDYSGFTAVANQQKSWPGVNLPKSKILINGGYRISSDLSGEIASNPSIMGKFFVVFELADYTVQNTVNGRGETAIIKTSSMEQLDLKIDDGKPLEGFVFGLNDWNALCNSGASVPRTGTYAQSISYRDNKDERCILSIVLNEY